MPVDASGQDVYRLRLEGERKLGDTLTLRNRIYFTELGWDSNGTLLNGAFDQSTYAALLAAARAVAASIDPTRLGRLVVTLPDGTVVLDTFRPDGDTPANANSFAHFQAKSINENLNTRVAMAAAQAYPCGVAIETKLSTTTGAFESQFAVRLGSHLSSRGAARLSMIASPLNSLPASRTITVGIPVGHGGRR
jgi:hypothetical protein